MSVTVPLFSGLTKAYRSVLSATGSFEISGASRCDDMSHLISVLADWNREIGLARPVTRPLLRRANEASRELGISDGRRARPEVHLDLTGGGIRDPGHQRLTHARDRRVHPSRRLGSERRRLLAQQAGHTRHR